MSVCVQRHALPVNSRALIDAACQYGACVMERTIVETVLTKDTGMRGVLVRFFVTNFYLFFHQSWTVVMPCWNC